MLRFDFQEGDRRGRYEKLPSVDDKAARRKRLWMKMNGRVKGVKLAHSRRKLNWKPFSIMFILCRRIARKYVDFVKRMKMDEAYPAIVFSCQWGLPILSHSSRNRRSNSISYRRSLTWRQNQHVQE